MVTGAGERGQLILIGAVLVAVTILGSIALLNAVHESPEINTQQDTRSAVETQRTVDQVTAGLERAFLVDTSMDDVDEPLPYAEQGGGFATLVEEYVTAYLNLSTTDAAGGVDVTLVGEQVGGIARQNQSVAGFEEYPSGTTTLIQGADAIPRLSLFVNWTSAPSDFTVRISETASPDSVRLEISDSGVAKFGPAGPGWTCDLSGDDTPIEIEFVNGVGEVRTAETYCGGLEFGTSLGPEYDVELVDGTDARGTYTITAVEPADITGFPADYRWNRTSSAGPTDYIVNPVFEIEYRTPNIAYNATYGLYNRTAP